MTRSSLKDFKFKFLSSPSQERPVKSDQPALAVSHISFCLFRGGSLISLSGSSMRPNILSRSVM
jgi:hypothetical protein